MFELLLAPPANRFKGVRNEDSTDDEEDEDADDEPSALGAEDLSLKGLELALVIVLAVSLLHS